MTEGAEGQFCVLCKASSFGEFRFGLLCCNGCGLVVDAAVFRAGEAEALNEDSFGEGFATARSVWVRWIEATKNRRYLANLRRAGVTSGKLLEVGVGTGAFLWESREAGFEVEGCDLSSSLCRRVQEVTGIKVHNLPLHALPQAAFDVVVMHHVLEHVADPVAFLRAARERLRPGGMLHVAVPNVACWEAALPGWNMYLPVHLIYFSPVSLVRTAENAGVKELKIRTHDTFASWFLTILRTVAGIRPREHQKIAASLGRVPSWWRYVEPPYRLAMVIAGVLLWPVRWLQGRLGKGDELLMTARSAD